MARGTAGQVATTLIPALAWVWAGCGPAPADPGHSRTATVRLEADPLLQVGTQERAASVVAGVTLTVTSRDGTSTQAAPLGTEHPEAEFQVTVPQGEARFQAAVTSNTGVVLYEGSREVLVDRDGFQVEIPLIAMAPVLVVVPASLPVSPAGVPPGPGVFILRNRGLDRVQWRVAAVSPLLDSCALAPCLGISPGAGAVTADDTGDTRTGTGFLRVEPLTTPARAYAVRLETEEGTVDLVVDAAAAGTVEARVAQPSFTGGAGPPVPDNQVRLKACSDGREGAPGFCIPDESVPISLGATDSDGIARFSGLPAGLWELQPDPTGWQSLQPLRATVSLAPGGFVSALFLATPIQSPPVPAPPAPEGAGQASPVEVLPPS
jgi:hypothetical protein